MEEQSSPGLGDELANNNIQHEIHFDANDENIEIVTEVVQCCYSHTTPHCACNPALTIQHKTPPTSYSHTCAIFLITVSTIECLPSTFKYMCVCGVVWCGVVWCVYIFTAAPRKYYFKISDFYLQQNR